MRLAYIAPLPASHILPALDLKPKFRNQKQHPATWVQVISEAIASAPDVEVNVVAHTRATYRMRSVCRNGVQCYFVPKFEPGHLDSLTGYFTARCQLASAVKKISPDIVQGFGTEQHSGWSSVNMGTRSVVQIQGIIALLAPYLRMAQWDKACRQRYERKAVCKATAVFVENEFVRQWVLDQADTKPVYVIPHGVKQSFFNVRPEFSSSTFLCVSALEPYKGVDAVIRGFAMSSLSDNARLIIVGTGGMLSSLIQLADELGVADNVDFAGQCSSQEVMQYMEKSIGLIHASRMDSSPNVITEAHAAGLPVIGTRVGGIPEMIHDGEDGFVVFQDDFCAISDRVTFLLENVNRAKDMGACGREKVKVLNDPVRIASLHIKAYREIMEM